MNRYPGPGGGARAADSGLMVPRRCARRWCSGWCAARRHALSAGPGLRQRAGGCCTRGGTLILRMRMRGAAGARTLKRLLVTPGLAATARHGNVMPCPRVVASPARFMEAAPVCCYSTGSEAATSSKDANRRSSCFDVAWRGWWGQSQRRVGRRRHSSPHESKPRPRSKENHNACALYRLYLGVADGMSIERVWTCRYSI